MRLIVGLVRTSAGVLGQAVATAAAGLPLGYSCWKLRQSDAFVTRTTDALIRSRLRAESDRNDLARGMRSVFSVGIGLGAPVVIIRVAGLFARK